MICEGGARLFAGPLALRRAEISWGELFKLRRVAGGLGESRLGDQLGELAVPVVLLFSLGHQPVAQSAGRLRGASAGGVTLYPGLRDAGGSSLAGHVGRRGVGR
jgi:hypothetical protein